MPPKRARNSYIRDHEHPAGRTHSAGYELITTAPRLRTAVFRGQGNRLGARPMAGSRRDPHRLRRRRNRWRVHQRICLEPVLRARAQNSSMFPPLPTSSGSGCQQGQEPDRNRSIMRRRDAMPPLACFPVHVSRQQAPAATDIFPRSQPARSYGNSSSIPVQLMDGARAARPRKPDSGHAGTISITTRVRRTSRNAMKPRIQRVLTP